MDSIKSTLSLNEIATIINTQYNDHAPSIQHIIKAKVIPEFESCFTALITDTGITAYDLTNPLINGDEDQPDAILNITQFVQAHFDNQFIEIKLPFYLEIFALLHHIDFCMGFDANPSVCIAKPTIKQANCLKNVFDLYPCLTTVVNGNLVPWDNKDNDSSGMWYAHVTINLELLYQLSIEDITELSNTLFDREPGETFTIEGYRTEEDCDNQANLEHVDTTPTIARAHEVHSENEDDFYLLTIVDNDGKLHS